MDDRQSKSPSRLLGLTTNLSFIDQALVSGGNFTAGILMARAFGLYEFGRFTLVWMAVEFLMSLQFALVLQPMLNIGAKQSEFERIRYFPAVAVQQVFTCLVMASVAWVAVALAGGLFNDARLFELAAPVFAAIVMNQFHSFFRRYLFLRERPFRALMVDVLRFGVQLPAILALLFLPGDSEASNGLWIIAIACTASTTLGACFFGKFVWDRAVFRQVIARHWEFSKWLLPSAVMHWLTSQAYLLMSGVVLGAAMTGGLRAAMGITGILNILVLALDSFAPARASRAFHEGGRAQLVHFIVRLAGLMGVLTLGTVVILNVAPELAIRLLYGEKYEGLGYLVRWLCAPAVLYTIAVILTIAAAAMEWTRLIFQSYIAATVFTLVAAYPLAYYAGLPGIVATWIVVELIRVAVLLAGLQSLPGDGMRLGIPLLVNYLQNLVQEGLSGGSVFLNRPPFVAKA
jgi:O-antigen/teichoic acid export membrane protein